MTDIMQFVSDMFTNECWSNQPQHMTEAEAAYNLAAYREENREIPEGLTPALFATLWNSYVYAEEDIPF